MPLAFIVLQIGMEITLPQHVLAVMHSENSLHETLQFLIMAAAFGVALWTLVRMKPKEKPWLAAWAGLAAFCCFYVAGEEISWGQHFLAWNTPEFWAQVNDQQETNLHNTSSWLDQKPRLLLEIGILVGGIIMPLLMRFKPAALPQRFAVIYPAPYLSVVALSALGIKLADEIGELLDVRVFERASEVEELYLFYFVLLYLLVLKKRVTG